MHRQPLENSGIRVARLEDADDIADIYAPAVRDSSVSFELVPPSAAEIRERLLKIQRQYPWLVYEKNGRVMGYVYASEHRVRKAYQWSAEVSAYVRPEAQRQGIARELYSTLFTALKCHGYANALAGITLPNDPSVTFHQAMGFQHVGIFPELGCKLGKWHDVGWWILKLQKLGNDPAPPIPFNGKLTLPDHSFHH